MEVSSERSRVSQAPSWMMGLMSMISSWSPLLLKSNIMFSLEEGSSRKWTVGATKKRAVWMNGVGLSDGPSMLM